MFFLIQLGLQNLLFVENMTTSKSKHLGGSSSSFHIPSKFANVHALMVCDLQFDLIGLSGSICKAKVGRSIYHHFMIWPLTLPPTKVPAPYGEPPCGAELSNSAGVE